MSLPVQYMFFFISVLLGTSNAGGDLPSSGCTWSGPSAEWVLSRRLPFGEMSGSLEADVIPYMHRNGIPISFVSSLDGDSSIRLAVSSSTTVREVLDGIVRQAPAYRYDMVEGRIVVYPKGEGYETVVEFSPKTDATRAQALVAVHRALKGRTEALQSLSMPVLRGFGGESIYGDTVDYGGTRTVIAHFTSLIQRRPSAAFQMLLTKEGRLYFDFVRVPLLQKIELVAPPVVEVGATFRAIVRGTLSDGSAILLEGPECHVDYGVTGEGVLTIDGLGLATALKKGTATIWVQHEGKRAHANIRVRESTGLSSSSGQQRGDVEDLRAIGLLSAFRG